MLKHIQNASIRPSFSTASVFGNYSPDAIAINLFLDWATAIQFFIPATGSKGKLGTIRHGTVSIRSVLSLMLLIITSYCDVERRCDTPHQTF